MVIAETKRLHIRWLLPSDAPFILELMNEPAYHANIGDRGITDLAKAEAYCVGTLCQHYKDFGTGLYHVSLKTEDGAAGEPIGCCGILNRPWLAHPDLGYAFLKRHWGKGYAREAAKAVMEHSRSDLGHDGLMAIVSPHNEPSKALLRHMGFEACGEMIYPDTEDDLVELFKVSMDHPSA